MKDSFVFAFLDGPDLYQRFNPRTSSPSNNPFKRIKFLNVNELRNEKHFICCTHDERLIASLAIQQSPSERDTIWLKHISVDQDFQNQGIASLLLENCFSHVSEEGKILEFSSFSDDGKMFLKPVIRRLRDQFPDLHIRLSDPLDFDDLEFRPL